MKLPRFLANIVRAGASPEIVTTRNFDAAASVLEVYARGIEGHDDQIGDLGKKIARTTNLLQILRHQVFNVLDYGAYGGHLGTIHDELIPIQNCIRAAKAAGANAVYLPPGDYGISATINLKTLLGISDAAINQGYFTLYGDNPGTTRIIPTANITGAMIECVNAGTGNAANARQLRFKGFSLYSDARLNKSADYGFYLKWCAEVFYDNVNVINCCNKRLIYHDTAFVCSFKNCDFVGKANELGDAGSGGAPDGPSNAMNFPPVSYDDRLTGIYFANTSTTTKVDSCRLNSCRIGINLNNGDGMMFINNAIESDADYGAYLSGSTTNVGFSGNYWEGNGGNVYISARADAPIFRGNFFHGGSWGIKIVGATIYAGVIKENSFSSGVDGIILDAPVLNELSITENFFDVDNDELVYGTDEFNTYGSQGHRIDWEKNTTTKNVNSRRFARESNNINRIDFQDWTASSGGITRTSSNSKNRLTNAYALTAPTQGDFLSYEIATIGSGQNTDLAGSWLTFLLPMNFTSIASYVDTGVTFSSSAGDLLCTHTSDFPDGSTVRYSGGVMPGNIVANTSYQVVRISATTCKLTAGAGNIAYTSAGSGTITMVYYQSGGKLRIDDGIVQHDYLLNISEFGVWKNARAYIKLSDTANTITVRLYPNGANFTVENLVVLKGLWGDSETRSDYNGKLYVHPPFESAKTPIRIYQGPTSNVVIAEGDNPGNPSYGVWRVRDNGGDPVAEMNGGIGFQTLVAGIPFVFFEGPRFRSGSVSPEGSVTASPGSAYLRTNGVIYVKETGTGNTGWVAVVSASSVLTGTATWDPANMATDGAVVSTTITVTGAVVGSQVSATLSSIGANNVMISAHVQAADTVRVVLQNKTGGALDIASGTLNVKVWV